MLEASRIDVPGEVGLESWERRMAQKITGRIPISIFVITTSNGPDRLGIGDIYTFRLLEKIIEISEKNLATL